MNGRGKCSENSMVETRFKTIKPESIWPVAWQARQRAVNTIARYIEGFNNSVRRHCPIGYQGRIGFER